MKKKPFNYDFSFSRLINDEDRLRFFELVKSCSQSAFKVDLAKILFPHVLGGSSVVEDEHLRTLCFGDYMHPEADKRTYDEIPDLSLLTKGDGRRKVPIVGYWLM